MTELVIRDGADVPVDAVMALFATVDWASNRRGDDVAAALAASVVLTVWEGEWFVAILRAISDGVYRALIEDVVVHPDARGRGHGRRLVEAALAHPRIGGVEEVILFTEVPAFWTRFGFRADGAAMKRWRG